MCRLILPNIKLEKPFRQLLKDFKENSAAIYPYVLKLDSTDFGAYLFKLKGFQTGKGIKAGYSPNFTYFMVNKKEEIIGVANIRTKLTDKNKLYGGHIGFGIAPMFRKKGYGKIMLQLSLNKALELGIDRVLLTCDFDNIGSKKIIEACGGVFESEVLQETMPVLRYWINN